MNLKEFHHLVETNSVNAIYYATKERILATCDTKSGNAIEVAAFFGHLSLLDQFVTISEINRVPSSLWFIAAETNNCNLAKWLDQKHVPILSQLRCCLYCGIVETSLWQVAAFHCSLQFLTWGMEQDMMSVEGLLSICLISPTVLQHIFKLLTPTKKHLMMSYFRWYLLHFFKLHNTHIACLRLLLNEFIPQHHIKTSFTSYLIYYSCYKTTFFSSFLSLVNVSIFDIHHLLQTENVHHPGARLLLMILDGNAIDICKESCPIKYWVFQILGTYLLHHLCHIDLRCLVMDYVVPSLPPGW